MCVTTSPAKLSNTIVYSYRTEITRKPVIALGYQNRVQSLVSAPNAMLLPFPAALPMTPNNVLDTSRASSILKDMAEALRPKPRAYGLSKGVTREMNIGQVHVFEHGIYTIVLASSAAHVFDALADVPTNKRPQISRTLLDAYATWYPNWHLAVCCFDTRQAAQADPLLWWYEPAPAQDWLFFPGLDCHSGDVPDLKRQVHRDHTLAAGVALDVPAAEVIFTERISSTLLPYVAPRVIGGPMPSSSQNGDWYLSMRGLRIDKPSFVLRQPG